MAFEELFFGFLICMFVCRFCMKRTLLRGITCASAVLGSAIAFATDLPGWQCLLLALGAWLVLALLAFLFLWAVCLRVDLAQEQESDSRFYRAVMNLYIEALKTLVGIRLTVTGGEKLPTEGRFLLVCNHLYDLDPGIPLTVFPKAQLAFISKKENLQKPIVGPLMLKIQCQLIDRENDRAALKTILKCISILKEDKASIAVFPEGRIVKDGYLLHDFRPGVFKIAQKAEVPIVVCTVNGTQNIVENVKHFRRTRIDFHLLEVIPAAELKGVTTVDIANRVHSLMAADLGAENVAN